jgi:chitosanase
MLTDAQKKTIQAIVNTFETGSPRGDYACITLLPGDPGHLTYGRVQASLASGNLGELIRQYIAAHSSTGAAAPTAALRPFLDRLAARDLSLDTETQFHALLREAADDPVMHRVQDDFFDRRFWDPALRDAQALGITTALGTAVVYDSHIHGTWAKLRDAVIADIGLPSVDAPPDEREWIGHYIPARRRWLAEHSNPWIRRAVYRMDAFQALLEAGNWDLVPPITVHGARIDADWEAAVPLEKPAAP